MEDKNEYYKKEMIKIADTLENLRLEMYPQIKDDKDKAEFSDLVFSLQSDIRYTLTDIIDYLLFKEKK